MSACDSMLTEMRYRSIVTVTMSRFDCNMAYLSRGGERVASCNVLQ
jgi:hypothetical protein